MSDRTDTEARKTYDDAIEVRLSQKYVCGCFIVFSPDASCWPITKETNYFKNATLEDSI